MHACSSMFIYDFFYLQEPLKKIRTNISKRIKNSRKPRSTERLFVLHKRNDHEDNLTGKVLCLYLLSNYINDSLVIRNLYKKTKHVLELIA